MERCEHDNFSRQIYNYEVDVMLLHKPTGMRRLSILAETEDLMDFDRNCTLHTYKRLSRATLHACRSYISSSFCILVVSCVLSSWGVQVEYVDRLWSWTSLGLYYSGVYDVCDRER